MYDLLEFPLARQSQLDELTEHLRMNGYTFDRIGGRFYVLEDETDYVITICKDRHLKIFLNDEEVEER